MSWIKTQSFNPVLPEAYAPDDANHPYNPSWYGGKILSAALGTGHDTPPDAVNITGSGFPRFVYHLAQFYTGGSFSVPNIGGFDVVVYNTTISNGVSWAAQNTYYTWNAPAPTNDDVYFVIFAGLVDGNIFTFYDSSNAVVARIRSRSVTGPTQAIEVVDASDSIIGTVCADVGGSGHENPDYPHGMWRVEARVKFTGDSGAELEIKLYDANSDTPGDELLITGSSLVGDDFDHVSVGAIYASGGSLQYIGWFGMASSEYGWFGPKAENPVIDDTSYTSTSATIHWTTPDTGGRTIIGYKIFGSTFPLTDPDFDPSGASGQDCVALFLPTGHTALFEGLTTGSTYSFSVCAVTDYGDGMLSPYVSVTPAITTPEPPEDFDIQLVAIP